MIKITESFKEKLLKHASVQNVCIAVLAFLTVAVVAVIGFSVNKITVSFDGNTNTFYSLQTSSDVILEQLGVEYSDTDQIVADQNGRLINLSVVRSFPVTVTFGKETKEINVTGGTVNDAITLAGFSVGEDDLVNLELDAVLSKSECIDIIDVEYVTETVTKTIPYESKTVYSDKYPKSTTKVTTKGQEGSKQVTLVKRYENGVLLDSEVLSEEIVVEKVDKVITVGTKEVKTNSYSSTKTISTLKPPFEIQLDENGIPVNYKSKKVVQATAYSPEDGVSTATGVTAKPGYIAVNPNIIPYGTKMFIRSTDGKYIYGYAVAADTGGFIKNRPTNVDLFFPSSSSAYQFGRRNVEIYFLS